jgi:hypothetical protein
MPADTATIKAVSRIQGEEDGRTVAAPLPGRCAVRTGGNLSENGKTTRLSREKSEKLFLSTLDVSQIEKKQFLTICAVL